MGSERKPYKRDFSTIHGSVTMVTLPYMVTYTTETYKSDLSGLIGSLIDAELFLLNWQTSFVAELFVFVILFIVI